jgi:hypothetical protein
MQHTASDGEHAHTSSGDSEVIGLFVQHPERVVAAWRRLRFEHRKVTNHLLEGLVENLVREIGLDLAGQPGSPWRRCRGVLRLSPARGPRALYEEFAALRHCLLEMISDLGGTEPQRQRVLRAINESVDGAIAHYERLVHPRDAPPPLNPFGGVILELFENERIQPRPATPVEGESTVH